MSVIFAWRGPGSLAAGPNEMTPLLHDGVLFVFGFDDHVETLEAATGDLLWEQSRPLPKEVQPSVKRNLALHGDRLFVPTSDSHLVALDIKTGKVIWDRAIGNYNAGFRITGGPLAGRQLHPGARCADGPASLALYTIARPHEPRSKQLARAAARSATALRNDPDLNLMYFGVAQSYDTDSLLNLVKQPGITNGGLYTDSTLALSWSGIPARP